MLVNYHCNGRGSPNGERSMPGLQDAADWMRNLTTSGEEYCAATIRRVSPFIRRLKSLGPWRGGGGGEERRKERKGEKKRERKGRRERERPGGEEEEEGEKGGGEDQGRRVGREKGG